MPIWGRVLAACLIVLIDGIAFLLPVGSLLIAYVLIARPRWFKEWVDRFYG